MITNSILFGTSNPNKIKEAQKILPKYTIVTPTDIHISSDIDEPYLTLEKNALHKVQTIYSMTHMHCFAEDTGLEVSALDGAPGVHTARYAGVQRNDMDNMQLLLKNLEPHKDRSARFRTIVALCISGETYIFEGILRGKISLEPLGEAGFGYDPIFIPRGYTQTLAELPSEVKNEISHRAKALSKLALFLGQADI